MPIDIRSIAAAAQQNPELVQMLMQQLQQAGVSPDAGAAWIQQAVEKQTQPQPGISDEEFNQGFQPQVPLPRADPRKGGPPSGNDYEADDGTDYYSGDPKIEEFLRQHREMFPGSDLPIGPDYKDVWPTPGYAPPNAKYRPPYELPTEEDIRTQSRPSLPYGLGYAEGETVPQKRAPAISNMPQGMPDSLTKDKTYRTPEGMPYSLPPSLKIPISDDEQYTEAIAGPDYEDT